MGWGSHGHLTDVCENRTSFVTARNPGGYFVIDRRRGFNDAPSVGEDSFSVPAKCFGNSRGFNYGCFGVLRSRLTGIDRGWLLFRIILTCLLIFVWRVYLIVRVV